MALGRIIDYSISNSGTPAQHGSAHLSQASLFGVGGREGELVGEGVRYEYKFASFYFAADVSNFVRMLTCTHRFMARISATFGIVTKVDDVDESARRSGAGK